jgi:hypothetical protein
VIRNARPIVIGLFGAFLGLTLVKFGNPVILDHLVAAPGSWLEWVFSTWPCRWVFSAFFGQFWFLGWALLATSAWAFRTTLTPTLLQLRQNKPATLVVCCLLGWYCWQWAASVDTVKKSLTDVTLSQFSICLVCFLFGMFFVSRLQSVDSLCWGLLVGFMIVLWAGLDQQFGGLEATRRMIYEQGVDYPEEFLRRISTGRIFGTLFYPNAFAGVILLLCPITITFVSRLTSTRGNILWGLAIGLLGYCSVVCLYWSGSKSGWLIAAGMVLLVLLRLPMARWRKWLLLGVVGAMALGAFGVRYAGYFQKGATSVVARFDYWNTALKVAIRNPLTGSGPGTFQVPYAELKAPDSEMARLVHNDYLQQASDSGMPGFLLYTGLLWISVWLLYRKASSDPIKFAAWLGVAAWAVQSFVEFGLYIPASAWPAFTLTGWLLGNEVDTDGGRK